MTLGARYQHIDKEMDSDYYFSQLGISPGDPSYSLQVDESWDAFLPKAALSYRLNDSWTTYASVARGYMPGGFNFHVTTGSGEDATFDPQQSTNYEIGIKGGWDRARLAAALFYMDIEDIQIYKFDEIITVGNADQRSFPGRGAGVDLFPDRFPRIDRSARHHRGGIRRLRYRLWNKIRR